MTGPSQRQTGAVLITALLFLIILTLISVTAMRASTLGLRMAGNEQEQRRALQSVQSAVQGVLAQTTLQVTYAGTTNCYRFDSSTSVPATCPTANTTTLVPGPGYGTPNVVSAKLDTLGACPRNIANSWRGDASYYGNGGSGGSGGCAYFTVDSSYNDTANRGGNDATSQGLIIAY